MRNFSTIARSISAVLLFLAFGDHPYGYYQLLRWVTCGTSTYSAFIAHSIGKKFWIWVFGITALLFNPLIPFHLSRDIWSIIDVAVGILFLVSIFTVRET
ncbi:MAG: hypothetical protein FD156_1684 [Nitrospirae bacterium]|nr:MAG: hypothetical protein FD156_1684 [Nitrospirota bacterium]